MWNREIHVPSVEEAKGFVPTSYDFSLARNIGLIDKDDHLTDRYLTAQAIYKAAFLHYINRVANIGKYEKALNKSGYVFLPVKYERQTVYQRYGSLDSRFFFVRNNFHIERLSKDDLKTLTKPPEEEALVTLAERTYKDVIKLLPPDVTTENSMIYDFNAFSATKAPDNALLIYMSHSWEFNDIGNLVSLENEQAKEKFAGNFVIQMQEQLSKALEIRVVVYAKTL